MGPDEDWTLGEVGRALVRVEADLREVKGDMKKLGQIYVTRVEHEQTRNEIREDIKDIKNSIAASRAPWWQVSSLVVGAAGLAISLVVLLSRIPN